MIRNVLLTVVFMAVLTGCGVTRQQMVKAVENYTPPVTIDAKNPKSLVYVVRPDSMGGIVSFEVSIDKTVIGKTQGSQYIYFYLVPGDYKIISKAENTAYLQLSTEAGKTYFIRQYASMGFLFARNELGLVDDVEGKYALTLTQPGNMIEKVYPTGK
jgi:hypothetical protein